MKMETVGGGVGKVFGRAFSGEALFQNIYTAEGAPGMIAMASSFPGAIRALEIRPGSGMILQKTAFLACETGVTMSVFFRKSLGTGFFGGEGFIMQKISGNGICFAEFDGHVVEYNLSAGQQVVIDTGNLAGMKESCTMEIKTVPGLKNKLLGGEGFFNTVVTGPGRVWLQTMPASGMAAALSSYLVRNN